MDNSIFQFDVSGFEVKGNHLSRKVEGTAYSGGAIHGHSHWDNVAFDLSSTRSQQVIPILLQHNPGKICGYTDSVTISNDIRFSGSLLQTTEGGTEIARLSDEGFPWELSIHISPKFTEEVSRKVINGRLFSGTVFRNSTIREISFCAVGADEGTSANVFNRNSKNFLSELMSQTVNQQTINELSR